MEIATYRSDGDKRRSFVVFEDDSHSASSNPKQVAIELETTGKAPPTARSKNGKGRTLKPLGTGEQTASRESVQQKSKYHALESIVVFRDRAKGMLNSNSHFTARLVCACKLIAYTKLKLKSYT